jgi:hypothetical protein
MSRGLKRFLFFFFTLYPSKNPKSLASSDLDLFRFSQAKVIIHLETKFIIVKFKKILLLLKNNYRFDLNNKIKYYKNLY